MKRLTNAQLLQQLGAERHNHELTLAKLESAQAEIVALRGQLNEAQLELAGLKVRAKLDAPAPQAQPRPTVKPSKRIFEFDPGKPGDYARASRLAREQGGLVRRATT
jgi:multidrug efflux pump subunit AcrA (membrane-fusion protein)